MKYRYENVKCVGVHDGDTITVIIDYGNKLTQELTVRLARINAPELFGNNKEEGIKSRDWLKEKILDKQIVLDSYKMEKYGRLLCEVYDENGKDINKEMIDKQLAVLYMEDKL